MVFSCIEVIKISFSVIFNKDIHALRGLHDFSTKKVSASGLFGPDTHQGALPLGPTPGALPPGSRAYFRGGTHQSDVPATKHLRHRGLSVTGATKKIGGLSVTEQRLRGLAVRV